MGSSWPGLPLSLCTGIKYVNTASTHHQQFCSLYDTKLVLWVLQEVYCMPKDKLIDCNIGLEYWSLSRIIDSFELWYCETRTLDWEEHLLIKGFLMSSLQRLALSTTVDYLKCMHQQNDILWMWWPSWHHKIRLQDKYYCLWTSSV